MNAFAILKHSEIYTSPNFLSGTSAWEQHTPFAFLLTKLVEPETFVELGTHKGDSFLAFCQAVSTFTLNTKCYAVDNWVGEEHSGTYSEDIYEKLKAYHDPLYAGFSTLLRKDFDAAVSDFRDATVDILHIDGLHTYEAVKNDFVTWKNKLSKKGVVLFHDTQVRERDFGVWKLWAELSEKYPSFEFHHGSGLGVLGVGDELSGGLKKFLSIPEADRDAIRGLFAALGHKVSIIGALKQSELLREALKVSLLEQDKKVLSRGREIEVLRSELIQKGTEGEELKSRIESLNRDLLEANGTLDKIYRSKSWRFLRGILGFVS